MGWDDVHTMRQPGEKLRGIIFTCCIPLPLVLKSPVWAVLDETTISLRDKPLPAMTWNLLDNVIIFYASLPAAQHPSLKNDDEAPKESLQQLAHCLVSLLVHAFYHHDHGFVHQLVMEVRNFQFLETSCSLLYVTAVRFHPTVFSDHMALVDKWLPNNTKWILHYNQVPVMVNKHHVIISHISVITPEFRHESNDLKSGCYGSLCLQLGIVLLYISAIGSAYLFNLCSCRKQNYTNGIIIITFNLSFLIYFCIVATPCASSDIWVLFYNPDIPLDLCLEAPSLDLHVFF